MLKDKFSDMFEKSCAVRSYMGNWAKYFLSVSKMLNHAYFNNPGGPEIEVFLELGLELLLVLDKYYKELGTCICNEY
jgi:hypothetical protein